MLRTHSCGELRKEHIGKKTKLSGWVDTIRNHGKVWFIDLRDRYGKTQIVFVEGNNNDFREKLRDISVESCISVEGEVVARKKGTENKEIETGEIEIFAESITIYNKCPAMPFELNDNSVGEDVRLKYRFLDLRSKKMQNNLILRHKVLKAINDFMDKENFIYIETPILAKSTPEGARDYIVPSRVHPTKFYALPQSPQIFKQLMMVAGFDRYYQIARCFRDEDLRADRQPEFTQLDIEMSFVDVEDIISEMENMVSFVFKEALNVDIKTPFPRISYEEAMKKYGRDNPDTRREGEKFAFVWVLDFPMFEWKEEDKRWYAMHHPFTSPEEDADFNNLAKIKAKAYDLVLNGSEIGGGSIRIHNFETQKKVFEALGMKEGEFKDKFGFLLNALSHGAPPHGGIAFGLDRVLQIMTESESIRDVITFPKNKAAQDIMMDAPSEISEQQMKEVHLKPDAPAKKKK